MTTPSDHSPSSRRFADLNWPHAGQIRVALLLMLMLGLVLAPGVMAQTVVVDPNLDDVREGILSIHAGGSCCVPGKDCAGRFQLRNPTGYDATGIDLVASDFTQSGNAPLAAGQVRFTPATLVRLAALDTAAITVSLDVPEGLAAGRWTGMVDVLARTSEAPTRLVVVVDVCAAVAKISLIRNAGDLGPDGVTLRPLDGCAGSLFEGIVRVAVSGRAVKAVPELSPLPSGATVAFDPARLSLQPGAEADVRMTVTLPESSTAATYSGAMSVRDVRTGAFDSATFTLVRCASPDDEGPLLDPSISDPPPLATRHLLLSHRVSRRGLRIGDVVTFTLIVRNEGMGPIASVVVEDQLPSGFQYARGRTAVDGRAGGEPQSVQPYRYDVGDLAAGEEVVVAFQATVTSAARRGRSTARAYARAEQVAVGPISVDVEVSSTTPLPTGAITGRVEVGSDGIAAVRLLLDSTADVVTDQRGEFRFDGVNAGDHAVSIDGRTLPDGHSIVGDEMVLLLLFPGAQREVVFSVARPARLGMSLRRVESGLTDSP